MRVQRRFSRTMLHLLGLCALLLSNCSPGHDIPQKTYNPELEYLKFVNGAGPQSDTRLIFLLMAEYLNTNQLEAGVEFFTAVLANHGEQMAPDEKSVYLSVLGVLRASYAPRAPLLKRKGWVNETIDMLEEARSLSNDQGYLARWATGVVYAQLPEQFGKKDVAREVLHWLLDHQGESPSAGLLREVYFQLARLSHEEENESAAREYLAHSGYGSFERDITTLTPFAVTADQGHTFHPQMVREVIPERVFALSGFEFTEYYFIVSKDGRHLISIDAGTHPDSAKAAYESLTRRYPNLPPLTTVFVTHAHWDHVGGHRYFRQLSPTPTFYARKNYREELLRSVSTTLNFRFFFGRKFTNELIIDFKPDTRIRKRTTVTVGGTRFALIPISGGETPDGMFIYLHEERVLFGGDFIMPYLGAPFVEEGNLKGLFEAIDIVESLNPEHLLHGHETLTR
ncbi:MAG: MBL fold metallo-hydrolase, partial [Nitrospiraceae bacterium]